MNSLAKHSDSMFHSRRIRFENLISNSRGHIESVQVHHLVPCSHEVVLELFGSIRASIHFGNGTQLRVRAEDKVVASRVPPLLASHAVNTHKVLAVGAGCLPSRAHVKKVDEEVVGQSA